MGKKWHPNCFKCNTCEIPLSPNNFFEKAGKPYCEKDYHKMFSPPCAGCGEPIKDSVIKPFLEFRVLMKILNLKKETNGKGVGQELAPGVLQLS